MNKLKYNGKGRVFVKSQDEYYEPIIFKEPGWTIKVYKPILTDEVRSSRMKRIGKDAANLYIAAEKAKRKEKEDA